MPLVPLYQWQTDKAGNIKRDSKGKPKLHPRAGTKKNLRDWTDAERHDFEQALEFDQSARRRSAQLIVEPLREAEKVLKQ